MQTFEGVQINETRDWIKEGFEIYGAPVNDFRDAANVGIELEKAGNEVRINTRGGWCYVWKKLRVKSL